MIDAQCSVRFHTPLQGERLLSTGLRVIQRALGQGLEERRKPSCCVLAMTQTILLRAAGRGQQLTPPLSPAPAVSVHSLRDRLRLIHHPNLSLTIRILV